MEAGLVAARVAEVTAGTALVVVVVLAAVRTFVVPRAVPVAMTSWIFRLSNRLFGAASRRFGAERSEDVLALFAPLTLLAMPVVWLTLLVVGFASIFAGVGERGWREAIDLAGSSLLTLGFARPGDLASTLVSFAAAGLGLALLALLITYLPSIYAAFSRREAAVTLLEVRAGSPPAADVMLIRLERIGWTDHLDDLWARFEDWFVDVEESHTSLAPLAYFRSPRPEHSWVTAAGAVLDAAALSVSTVAREPAPRASLMIRSGYVALRHIADFFNIDYDPDPSPGDPISIRREEFEAVYDRLARAGVPVVRDREQAWRDFAGWRVNYDAVLIGLAAVVAAPPAPWSSDRATVTLRSSRSTRRPGRRDPRSSP